MYRRIEVRAEKLERNESRRREALMRQLEREYREILSSMSWMLAGSLLADVPTLKITAPWPQIPLFKPWFITMIANTNRELLVKLYATIYYWNSFMQFNRIVTAEVKKEKEFAENMAARLEEARARLYGRTVRGLRDRREWYFWTRVWRVWRRGVRFTYATSTHAGRLVAALRSVLYGYINLIEEGRVYGETHYIHDPEVLKAIGEVVSGWPGRLGVKLLGELRRFGLRVEDVYLDTPRSPAALVLLNAPIGVRAGGRLFPRAPAGYRRPRLPYYVSRVYTSSDVVVAYADVAVWMLVRGLRLAGRRIEADDVPELTGVVYGALDAAGLTSIGDEVPDNAEWAAASSLQAAAEKGGVPMILEKWFLDTGVDYPLLIALGLVPAPRNMVLRVVFECGRFRWINPSTKLYTYDYSECLRVSARLRRGEYAPTHVFHASRILPRLYRALVREAERAGLPSPVPPP